jgi:hypothetical protein
MDEEQFNAAMEAENPSIEDILNIADEKRLKSEAENKTAFEKKQKEEEEARKRAEAEAKAKAEEEKNPPIDLQGLFGNLRDEDDSSQNDVNK